MTAPDKMTVPMSRDLADFSKLSIREGRIFHFVYQQDGSRQEMSCTDTLSSRLFISWLQIHDSPTTGHEAERNA